MPLPAARAVQMSLWDSLYHGTKDIWYPPKSSGFEMRRTASHVDIMMNTCGCIFWYWKFSCELTIKILWGHKFWKFKIIMWIDNQGMHCYQLNNSIINKTLKVGGCIALLLPRSVWSPLSQNHTMMTSWHGNARHITGFVRGTTGYDGFPPQRVNNTQLWCFLYIILNILLNKLPNCWWFERSCCFMMSL